MKSVILALTAAAVIATPALAKQRKHPPRMPAQAAMLGAAGSARPAITSYSGPDPYGVYINGQMIGRDPDPNVRQELVYDYVATHRW